MKQVIDVLLPGVEEAVEVEVEWVGVDDFMPGQEGGELSHPDILSATKDGTPLELTDAVYWSICEAL